ncbi:MAG: CopG family transcriptional regulator [Acidimicrobiia bacterium]
MARTQTMVQLSDELIELVDAEAARRGLSRSALIRQAITEHLAAGHEAAITRKIVEGYQRVPPITPDAWGLLEDHQDEATVELLQRLDADERAGGRKGKRW